MEIIGDKEFIVNTKKALKLIKENSPFWYNRVIGTIGKLVKHKTMFLYPYEKVTYYVGDKISNSSTLMYASCILREAQHTFLVSESIRKNKQKEYGCYDGKENMKSYYEIQLMILIELGEPKSLIEEVEQELKTNLEKGNHEIIIIGNKQFIENVKKALELLKTKDYMSYKTVIQNIRKVIEFKESPHTYFDRFQDLPTCFLNEYDSCVYIENLAAALLHEACHNKLYREALDFNKNPDEYSSGYSAEMYCLTREIECLKKLDAPEAIKQHYIGYYDIKWWEEDNQTKYTRKH